MGVRKCETIVQNFKHNIKLTGITRVHFIKSEWENNETNDRVSWMYLGYRAIFLAYFLIFLSHSIYREKRGKFWPIMATHWSFLVQTFYALIFFGNILHRFIRYRQEVKAQIKRTDSIKSGDICIAPPTQLNICDSITWLTLNIAGTVPYIVSIGYWVFVYNNAETGIFWNLTVHGFNAVLAFIDMLVIAIPIRVAHSLYTILFAFLYLVFSAIYEYGGGEYKHEDKPYIYSLLNWREDPDWTVLSCVVALIAAFFLHMFLWTLFRLRMVLVAKFQSHGCCFSSRA